MMHVTKKTTGSKIIWVLDFIFLPIIAMCLHFFLSIIAIYFVMILLPKII